MTATTATAPKPAPPAPEIITYVKMATGEWMSPWATCEDDECVDCDELSYAIMNDIHMVGDYVLIPVEVEGT